eukprot:TRINITY_DN17459_c0_g2_i1.p1 TRINITY_DN17459_c0_g2~~TRINITY_DN17459_c0_g2_i1.p1  ORF type:complete len:456 (-),score=31.45 TRINITY_DN17459_c0_g2_i1:58-1371(-)
MNLHTFEVRTSSVSEDESDEPLTFKRQVKTSAQEIDPRRQLRNPQPDSPRKAKVGEQGGQMGGAQMGAGQLDGVGVAYHDPDDISNGREPFKIPWVNEYTSEAPPKDFQYMAKSKVFELAQVDYATMRLCEVDKCVCKGDCLALAFGCACTASTRGTHAYTPSGQLSEEFIGKALEEKWGEKSKSYCPERTKCITRAEGEEFKECKGHVTRTFIKECCNECRCNALKCGNRVVQRGIKAKLEVFFTPEGKGWGIRTRESLPKGAFICEYAGDILTNNELYDRNSKNKEEDDFALAAAASKASSSKVDFRKRMTFPINLDCDWTTERIVDNSEALSLDATYRGNVGRFINHRCEDSNLVDVPVLIHTPGDRRFYHVAFFTRRAVEAMEELSWDYTMDFKDNTHEIEAFTCLCGSPWCQYPGEIRPLAPRVCLGASHEA